ncbi:MAG: TraB/GumN family protein [Rubrivivax sp.]|nr:TraB/GumN family protein [Rubrivivax sp.]
MMSRVRHSFAALKLRLPSGAASAIGSRWRRRDFAALLLTGAAVMAQAQAQTQPRACPPVARQPSAEQIQAAQAAARDRGFLWRISKDGRSSYLYGTIHLGKLDWAVPGPALLKALSEVDVMALELDVSDSATLQKLQSGMARKPDEPALPPALQRRLSEETAAACLPANALDAQQPAVRALTLVLLAARWDGLDAGYAQELVLAGVAQSRGLPVVGLETVEEQLEALLPDSPAARLHFIEQAMAQLKSGAARRGTQRLVQAWAEGRLEELASYEQWCECVKTEEDRLQMRRLNDDRNPALASRIDRLHQQGKTVFAGIGALHMTGPKALPLLLQQRGYVVERVSSTR